MKLQSIVWIPLAILLTGCGESTSQRATRLAEAKKLIAEGLDEIAAEHTGGNIAFDSRCLPNVLDKWEKAVVVLRPMRPQTMTYKMDGGFAINIHFDLDQAMAAGRACQAAGSLTEKREKFGDFRFEVMALASLSGFPNPFDSTTARRGATIYPDLVWSPDTSHPSQASAGPIGSTPGFPITEAQKQQLRDTARATGVSEQEMEAMRVYATHVAAYPEDGPGTANDRARKREQSRQAAGW